MFRSILAASLLMFSPLLAGQATFGQSADETRPESGDKVQIQAAVSGWIETVKEPLALSAQQQQQLAGLYLNEVEQAFTGPTSVSPNDKEAINQALVDAWQRLRNIHSAASAVVGPQKAERYFELERARMVSSCVKHLAALSLTPVQEARIREIIGAEADMMLKYTQEDLRHRKARTDMANKLRRRIEQSERDIESLLTAEQKSGFAKLFEVSPLRYLG
ncbi:hypothetical protein LLH00_08130 [bacterium]|nr:hypothetical protein [bacterium]